LSGVGALLFIADHDNLVAATGGLLELDFQNLLSIQPPVEISVKVLENDV